MNKYEAEKKHLEDLATKQQMSASDPKSSVWVEASAGTGKTKVLSDRVLRLLLEGVNPSKILCLTYTKAAAVEMNERIAKKLSNWAVYDNTELEKDLAKLLGKDFFTDKKELLLKNSRTLFAQLLDAPGGMKIQTIHSFCQEILKRFPLEAGISPYFEILDDRNSKEILQNIQSDILSKADDSIKNEVDYLVKEISEFKFPEIMNLITENRNKIDLLLKKYTNISDIMQEIERRLGISSELTEEEVKQKLFCNIDIDLFNRCRDAFLLGGKEDNKRGTTFCKISESNFSPLFFEEYKDVFFTTEGKRRANLARKDAIKVYPQILDFMSYELDRVEQALETIKAIKVLRSTKAMLYISKKIVGAYNEYKDMCSVLDYEDLIVKTKVLLENRENTDWVLFKLDGGIDHILIDEAQDTSPNQWAIIRALTEEFFAGKGAYENKIPRSVFVVGDRKQSIYSFQGADPKEFDNMYQYFSNKSSSFRKVHLDVSFRSTKAIMDCVNTLFDVKEIKSGVIAVDEKINHRPFRIGEGGSVEINSLVQGIDNDKNDNYNWHIPLERVQKSSPSNLLAKKIAQNIKSMVENKELLESKNRPIRYGDFMFLVQRRNSFVEEFVRACKEIGVNVAGVDKLKLLEQIAAQDLISLGKFLLSPYDDLSLAEILKSPLFGLNDDDLFKICYNRKVCLFENMKVSCEYEKIVSQLEYLLSMSKKYRPFEIYSYVLTKLQGRKKFVMRMGNDVEDVLDEFLNLTINFEQNNIPSLENFIDWIIKDEVIVKKEMEQGDNDTVKIMTVHGSKGLQAPIVILADTVRVKTNAKKADFLWNDGLFYFPLSSASYNKDCNDLLDVISKADLEEYRRLLYVALTRAEDRLYISGYTSFKNIKEESWYSLLENNLKSNEKQLDEDTKVIYKCNQEIEFEEKCEQSDSIKSVKKDYGYLLIPAKEENIIQKHIAPSKGDTNDDEIISSPIEDDGNFYKRGTAIHKLLQYITNVDIRERYNKGILFLKKELPTFSDEECNEICMEVLNLIEKFSDLFLKDSKSEVPIMGEIDGKMVIAKIDRLVIAQNRVLIVDYKTNRPAAKCVEDVPKVYISQLNCYKKLLKKIYPDKEVITYLLWTNTCNLMKV